METDDKQQRIRQMTEQLNGLDTAQLEAVQHTIDALKPAGDGRLHLFGRWLGIEWDDEGRAVMALGPQNANTYGVAQGGALYSLADIAIGYKILQDLPPDRQVYTLELKMNYTKKGEGSRVRATPQILHMGRYTVVAECRLEDDNGDMVAVAMGTFFLADVK